MKRSKPCAACGRTDHPERAHYDPKAAIRAAEDAAARGESQIAGLWYEVATKLANAQRRELRGIGRGR